VSVADCAGLVERGDPDRLAAVMAAPVGLRARLWPLYAFNLEVAKAAWVTKEPMIAEMRLQWWRDVVAEPTARAHEVAGPLRDLIAGAGLSVAVLDRMAAARVWDVYKEAFEDQADFDRYIDETSGGLMWLSAKACGAADQAEASVRAYGWAAGLAGYLRAVPELEKRGRLPLVDGRAEAVQELARVGLAKLAQARAGRALVGKAAPALLAGWQAEGLLKQVVTDPRVVAEGRMGLSEFVRRGGLVWQAFTGRW
jgi:phytoene synthase